MFQVHEKLESISQELDSNENGLKLAGLRIISNQEIMVTNHSFQFDETHQVLTPPFPFQEKLENDCREYLEVKQECQRKLESLKVIRRMLELDDDQTMHHQVSMQVGMPQFMRESSFFILTSMWFAHSKLEKIIPCNFLGHVP